MLAFNDIGKIGRLGNQMFQYAGLRGIAANLGYEFCIPYSSCEDVWFEHQLFQVFTLKNLKEHNIKLLDDGHAPIAKQRTNFYIFDEDFFNYCPDDVSLLGYFPSEKYFQKIKASIKEDFTFHSNICELSKAMICKLDKPISLHVRRTDYKTDTNALVLDPNYYLEALKLFDKDRIVIIFSDDPEWCKQQEFFSSKRFLISETKSNAIDLCLMSLCSAHIIANSTFSWWGAWLANSEKVVAPKKWDRKGHSNLLEKNTIADDWHCI